MTTGAVASGSVGGPRPAAAWTIAGAAWTTGEPAKPPIRAVSGPVAATSTRGSGAVSPSDGNGRTGGPTGPRSMARVLSRGGKDEIGRASLSGSSENVAPRSSGTEGSSGSGAGGRSPIPRANRSLIVSASPMAGTEPTGPRGMPPGGSVFGNRFGGTLLGTARRTSSIESLGRGSRSEGSRSAASPRSEDGAASSAAA